MINPTNEEKKEAWELEQKATEVKTAVHHHRDYDDGPSPHGFVLASTTVVEPGDDNDPTGVYHPTPPHLTQIESPPPPTVKLILFYFISLF